MPTTTAVLITRNAPGRFRGFAASCMLEVAPGVYVAPDMDAGVRERLWNVMLKWAAALPDDGGVLLIWRDADAPSGLQLKSIGWPQKELVDHEGLWLTFKPADDAPEETRAIEPHPEPPDG